MYSSNFEINLFVLPSKEEASIDTRLRFVGGQAYPREGHSLVARFLGITIPPCFSLKHLFKFEKAKSDNSRFLVEIIKNHFYLSAWNSTEASQEGVDIGKSEKSE